MTDNTPKPAGNDPRDLRITWTNLIELFEKEETSFAFALQIVREVQQECRTNNCSMEALTDYWQESEDWNTDMNNRHLAETWEQEDCDCELHQRIRKAMHDADNTCEPVSEEEQQRKELIRENMRTMSDTKTKGKRIGKKTSKRNSPALRARGREPGLSH